MFCKYKNALGELGKGIHSIRIFNIAIIDVIMTIIGAWIFSQYIKVVSNKLMNFSIILAILFIAGIILHRLFCVRTTIDKLLFPSK